MIQEIFNRTIVNIIQGNAITGDILPVQPHLFQEKLMKGRSAKFLFGCTTPIIIDTAIRYRHPARFNNNLNDILALYLKMVGLRKYPGVADNLVRYILQLLMEIVNTDNCHVIVNANVDLSTLRVSEAGYPLQVFVFPYTLMLNVLIFLIHIAKLAKIPEIGNDTIFNHRA